MEAISNVASVGFRYLCKGDLEESEAKEFASKNSILNLKALVRETMRSIEGCQPLKNLIKLDLNSIKVDLMVEVDNLFNGALINLADNYPQAAAAGGTPRMRDAITSINRVEDEEMDFLVTKNIKISDYL